MRTAFLISSVLFTILFTSCKRDVGKTEILIENDLFSKTFICSQDTPGPIRPVYYRKTDGKILNQTGIPYFEFMINEKLTTSCDSLWVFRDLTRRGMNNGGTEYRLVFSGVREHVRGMDLTIVQQLFPGSTLVREKLLLHTSKGAFRLNKKQDRLHFRFPQYAVMITDNDNPESLEIKLASWEARPVTFGDKVSGNHMFYPELTSSPVHPEPTIFKGPLHILRADAFSWITSYEHASQDNTKGLLRGARAGRDTLINDALQGTRGVFRFPLRDEDFKFLGIATRSTNDHVGISVDALRGAYLDGEVINARHPYETVWTASAFYEGNELETGKAIIRNYLFNQINEKAASRKPEFYYNTWAMQRQAHPDSLRSILTYERIFQEIEYAAQLGVDIFVLDDGWEQAQGIWTPHKERLPQGLAPIKEKLDGHGIKMGIWFSPMGIDSTTQRYKEYQEWVIRDSEGNPIQAQWGQPAFDFVSDFFDLFIEDCKKLIDQGCLFMKWDAINSFYSTLPGLRHGSEEYSEEERRARYEYLLPLYVVKAMEILTDYEPELVIEIDLTEARRAMMGLAPLSQGKLFFMNNGASWYNDYSCYRTKSMRTIANEYAGLIPLELFTYANYPHDLSGCMEYNVNNSLLAGHGFWGNLALMTEEERLYVAEKVNFSKRVLPYIAEVNPVVTGKVGDSPEIYMLINREEAAGQVISFSDEPARHRIEQHIASSNLLAVLNNPYVVEKDVLEMDLHFGKAESTSAVFLIPNEGNGMTVVSSTSPLLNGKSAEKYLEYEVNKAGTQMIRWPVELGKPAVESQEEIEFEVSRDGAWYNVEVTLRKDRKTNIILESRQGN